MYKQTTRTTFIVMLLCLLGCKAIKVYTNYCAPIRTDNIQKITFEIQNDTLEIFEITEKKEMKEFITDLNNSKVNGPWKGVKWDKIIIHSEDGETVFNTNGKVFGQGSSGIFYNLNNKYKHYWKK